MCAKHRFLKKKKNNNNKKRNEKKEKLENTQHIVVKVGSLENMDKQMRKGLGKWSHWRVKVDSVVYFYSTGTDGVAPPPPLFTLSTLSISVKTLNSDLENARLFALDSASEMPHGNFTRLILSSSLRTYLQPFLLFALDFLHYRFFNSYTILSTNCIHVHSCLIYPLQIHLVFLSTSPLIYLSSYVLSKRVISRFN
jgi:hypothetical protein